MTRFTRVHLVPAGPFHFGGRGVGMEHSDVGLAADSLFSALCVIVAEDAGAAALEALLRRFQRTEGAGPPFRLTSLMPYAGAVHLLPYPSTGAPKTPAAADMRRRKAFKDIAWVSESVFRVLARGEPVPQDALDNGMPVALHGGKIWVTAAEKAALASFRARDPETNEQQEGVLWRTAIRPRVTVDRRSSASAVYSTGATHFNRCGDEQAGLYTVIEWLDADRPIQDTIKRCFKLLGEAGIGGERSTGHGHFTPVFDDLDRWDIAAPAGAYFATLSPYLPAAGEAAALQPGSRYEIVLRRGWLSMPGYSNLRRGAARMLADGSVLCWPEPGRPDAVLGELADVTPRRLAEETGRRVYRYGLAFPVRVAAAAMAQGGAA